MRFIIPLLLSIVLSPLSWSADFEKGSIAARNGDFATALREWTPLAEQGNASAQYNLGQIYRRGDGVPQDYKTEVKWYTRAAEQGNATAQYNLGVMYEEGNGVLQDDVYAHMWWNIAASNGDEDSSKSRNQVAEIMTTEQIAEAQKLARECVAKNYKGC